MSRVYKKLYAEDFEVAKTRLFLVFLVLKLTGFIHWSWWWVTAPLWAGIVIVLLILLAFGGLVGILKALK